MQIIDSINAKTTHVYVYTSHTWAQIAKLFFSFFNLFFDLAENPKMDFDENLPKK